MASNRKRISISTSRQINLFSGQQETVVREEKLSPQATSVPATSQQYGNIAKPSTQDTKTSNEFAGLHCHVFDLLNALWLYRQKK